MLKKMILLTLIGLFLCVQAETSANSIWARRSKDAPMPYADDTSRNIGDVLTILIDERSAVENEVERLLDRSAQREHNFDGNLNIDNITPRMPGFTMEASSSNTLDGRAEYEDARRFTDAITVTVMDVLPNGNLVVLGERNRETGGDPHVLEISGIVRPSDIGYDNTIESQRVANFNVVARGDGISEPYTRPGWLGRIFDVLWPF